MTVVKKRKDMLVMDTEQIINYSIYYGPSSCHLLVQLRINGTNHTKLNEIYFKWVNELTVRPNSTFPSEMEVSF